MEGEGIKPYTEKILKSIVYRMILEEGTNGESAIAYRTARIAELLGLFVDCEFLIPMMISHLHDTESKSVPRFVTSCLTAMGSVVKWSSIRYKEHLEQFMPKLINLILKSDFLQSDNLEVLIRCL